MIFQRIAPLLWVRIYSHLPLRQLRNLVTYKLNSDNPLGGKSIVGASLLAKILDPFASKLAPTGLRVF